MIKKQCVICGKVIEVINPQCCLCSDECRRVRDRMRRLAPEYRAKVSERRKRRYKEQRWKHIKVIPCKICGKPVEPSFFDGRMYRKYHHDECVLSEALQAVSEGCDFKDKRVKKAYNLLGYTLKELREEMCDR